MLNNIGESGHPCLVPDLMGKCFQFFTTENNVFCMLIIYGLYHVEVGSFYDYFLNQFSRSVVSESLRPHESQHDRPPCPSPTPGVHSDSRPSSQ